MEKRGSIKFVFVSIESHVRNRRDQRMMIELSLTFMISKNYRKTFTIKILSYQILHNFCSIFFSFIQQDAVFFSREDHITIFSHQNVSIRYQPFKVCSFNFQFFFTHKFFFDLEKFFPFLIKSRAPSHEAFNTQTENINKKYLSSSSFPRSFFSRLKYLSEGSIVV